MNNLPRVLVIDDDASDRALTRLVMAAEFGKLELESAGTAAEFSGALAAGRFGIVITEADFSWGDGVDVIRLIREMRPDCPVILFTAVVSEELWSESLRLGVDGYVAKSPAGFVRLPAAGGGELARCAVSKTGGGPSGWCVRGHPRRRDPRGESCVGRHPGFFRPRRNRVVELSRSVCR